METTAAKGIDMESMIDDIKNDQELQRQFRECVKGRIGKKSLKRWIEMLIAVLSMDYQEYGEKLKGNRRLNLNICCWWESQFAYYKHHEKQSPGSTQEILDIYWLNFPECFPPNYNQLTLF